MHPVYMYNTFSIGEVNPPMEHVNHKSHVFYVHVSGVH